MNKRLDCDAHYKRGFDIDFYALQQAAARQKWLLVTPPLVVFVLLCLWFLLVPPTYTAVARIARPAPEKVETLVSERELPPELQAQSDHEPGPLSGDSDARLHPGGDKPRDNGQAQSGASASLMAAQAAAATATMDPAALLRNQAARLSSEEFARRAIAQLRESTDFSATTDAIGFDLVAAEAWQTFGAFLHQAGFNAVIAGEARTGDPARDDDLVAWLRRKLTITVNESAGDIAIAFSDKNAILAARIANKFAELFLDIDPHAGNVAAAVPVRQAGFAQDPALLALGPFAALLMGVSVLFTREWRSGRLVGGADMVPQRPRALGEVKQLTRFDPLTPAQGEDAGQLLPLPAARREETVDVADIAGRIRASRRDGLAAHIVFTGVNLGGRSGRPLVGLGRQLAQEGRTILIDLGGVWQNEATATQRDGTSPGLTKVLKGEASFAEAIRRDPISRLHILSGDPEQPFDLHAFDVVFAALSQTYDYILLTTPPLDQSPVASKLTARADLVILTTLDQNERMVASAHKELCQNAHCEVLVIGVGGKLMPRLVDTAA